MKKEIFKLLVAEFEKLGINPTKWLGTRTNVKRLGKKNLADTPINEFAIQGEFENRGAERILKLFDEEAKYLAQLNDVQANQLLNNLKTVNKIVNPPPKPEAGIYQFSKLPGEAITPAEYTGKAAADQQKIQSAMLKAGMSISRADQELAKRLKLDMSKASNFDKLQAWKEKHGVPDFTKDAGIGSLFKVVSDNPLADLGSQLDNIAKEGRSLADEAQKLVDLAWKMSPEGKAAEEAIRKDINRRSNEGKGFAGGVFGARNDGFFRAVVRPFLLAQHDKGRITLADNTLNSLKNMDDLKGGGDFMSADPVRIFRQHYGDDAFDLIPDQEAFGMGPSGFGPTSQERVRVLENVIGKPILTKGPDNPGGYLTKGEYQAKLDHQDEVLGYIKNKEGRFGDMTEKELAEEIADVQRVRASLLNTFMKTHPTANFQKKDFPQNAAGQKAWQDAEVKAQYKEMEPEVKAEIGPGETQIEGRVFEDITPTAKLPSKEPLNIRLMKNFDQELTDEGLAGEGYNLQEIGVIKRARNRMTSGEEPHPNEALLREKELLADEAGVDLDELEVDIDWGDMTPEPFASGGGVGSLFRKTDRARYSTAGEVGKQVAKFAGKTIGEIMEILKKNKKIRDLIEKTNKKLHETGIVKMWHEKTKLDKDSKIVAEKVLAPFVETVEKMYPYKTSSKSARNSTLAWFREELTNPKFKKVYHPDWGEGRWVYRGEKSKKNLEYSEKNPSHMFSHGENLDYMFNPENVGGFASKDPSQAIKYATQAEGFPHVKKIHLKPIEFQEAAERNVIENPFGHTSDVILDAEQKSALKTDLLATGIAAVKKYWPFSKGGSVSRQRRYENGITSMFRRV